MPGLFCVLTQASTSDIGVRLERGIHRLVRHPWHFAKQLVASPLGIASIQRAGRLSGGDLWVAPDDSLVVAIDGELYGAQAVTSDHGGRHVLHYPTASCAAHIGALFCQDGSDWVKRVRGAFAVTIFDRKHQNLWLFTDRFGFRPLSYAHVGKSFVAGSAMASFTAAFPEETWKLDLDAVANWFTFQHVLGEKSFLEQVKVLPNAGRLCYDLTTGKTTKDCYWTLEDIDFLPDITFQEAVEEACLLFERAVGEQASGENRAGVYLTSGLDSRSTAGFLAKLGKKMSTFTYGATGCRDMVWGAAIAEIVNSKHYSFPLDDGTWIPRYAAEFHAASESYANCYQASHGISDYPVAREAIDVHLSGYGGGSFAGGDTTTVGALSMPTSEGRAEELYKAYGFALGNVFRYPLERYYLFCPGIREQIQGRAEASFHKEFQRCAHLRPDIIGDAFTLNNRYKKMFAYLVAVERDYFEDRCPFMDYDFINFLFSIPTKLRLGRQIQIGMLKRALPEMTTVPWQVTARRPTLASSTKASRWFGKFQNLLRHWGLSQSLPFEPGRNYAKWLREDGIDWVRTILDCDRLEQRNVLSRAYLCDLLERIRTSEKLRYPEQRNLAFRIGSATSFEIMCRIVLDGTDPQSAVRGNS